MIVIVVLGIIATLTIPALVNKNKESVAKTKVRKAMAAYESALNKMIIENDLKSDTALTTWANTVNCPNSTQYFKKVQDVNGCTFKTSDGIWWNISDIERPLIAFNQGNLTTEKANSTTDMSAFVLVGRFGNDGSLRVDDLAYETANSVDDTYGNSSKAQVEKLYTLLGMKKSSSSSNTTPSPFAACNHADTCEVGGITYTKVTFERDYSQDYMYCDPEDWNDNTGGCRNWKTGTSTAAAGEYYIAIEGYPDDYDTQAHDYDGSTCQYCQDEDVGDYYNAAKRHCSGNLANAAQLNALAYQGLLPSGWFWASEKDPYHSYNVNYGIVAGYNGSEYYIQVLCLGQ